MGGLGLKGSRFFCAPHITPAVNVCHTQKPQHPARRLCSAARCGPSCALLGRLNFFALLHKQNASRPVEGQRKLGPICKSSPLLLQKAYKREFR